MFRSPTPHHPLPIIYPVLCLSLVGPLLVDLPPQCLLIVLSSVFPTPFPPPHLPLCLLFLYSSPTPPSPSLSVTVSCLVDRFVHFHRVVDRLFLTGHPSATPSTVVTSRTLPLLLAYPCFSLWLIHRLQPPQRLALIHCVVLPLPIHLSPITSPHCLFYLNSPLPHPYLASRSPSQSGYPLLVDLYRVCVVCLDSSRPHPFPPQYPSSSSPSISSVYTPPPPSLSLT